MQEIAIKLLELMQEAQRKPYDGLLHNDLNHNINALFYRNGLEELRYATKYNPATQTFSIEGQRKIDGLAIAALRMYTLNTRLTVMATGIAEPHPPFSVGLIKIPCECQNVEMGSYKNQTPIHTPAGRLVGIDTCLLNEIKALWLSGITTVESCCGHNKTGAYIAVLEDHAQKMLDMGYRQITTADDPMIGDRKGYFYPKTLYHSEHQPSTNHS